MRRSRPGGVISLIAAAILAWGGPGAQWGRAETAVERADVLRQSRQFEEALDILREERASIIRADGEESLLLLPLDDLKAEILIDQGAIEEATAILDKTIAIRQRLATAGAEGFGKELAASLAARVRLLTVAKRLPDAVVAARQALIASDGAAGPQSEAVAKARTTLLETVDALERFLGPGDGATITARDDAATTLASLGMFADAIGQRRRILDCLTASAAADATARLTAREQLARLMLVAGRADEAIPLIATSITGTASADGLQSGRLLGELQLAADQLIAADASFQAVLEALRATERVPTCGSSADRLRGMLVGIRRGALPRSGQDLAQELTLELRLLARPTPDERLAAIDGLVVAGDILRARRDPTAAVEQFSRALATAAALKPPPAPQVADVSARVAAAHLAAGDVAAALKVAESALTAAERDLGPGDARVCTLRLVLADALRRSDQADKALDLLDKTLDRDLPRPDHAWEQAAVTICDSLATGERGAALPERYIAVRARQFGESHPHVGRARSLFGAARLAAGDWPAAVDHLTRSIPLLQASLGDDHPEVAAGLTLLAHAQQAQGEPAVAADTAARAVASWERIAGPTHPGTLAAVEVLAAARLRHGQTDGVEELLKRLSDAELNPDPVRRAGHLVRLAALASGHDQAAARGYLQAALTLPCWDAELPTETAGRLRLAFTAARAAHTLTILGDPTRSEDALRRARSLALKLENSRQLLERLEKLAADGTEPTATGT